MSEKNGSAALREARRIVVKAEMPALTGAA